MKKLLSAFFVATLLFGASARAEETFTVAAETTTVAVAEDKTIVVDPVKADEAATTVVVNPGSTAAETVTVIHGSKLLENIGSVLYALLAGLAVWVYSLLSKSILFNKMISREQYQKLVDPLLNEAVAFGVGRLKSADWADVETKNEALGTAANYVIDHGPELLKKFGIGREALLQKLEAKLVENGWDTKPGQWSETPNPDKKV